MYLFINARSRNAQEKLSLCAENSRKIFRTAKKHNTFTYKSTSPVALGFGIIGALVLGYVVQKYLPPPVPKIVGFDLGTTFSSAAVYHAGTGDVEIIRDHLGRKAFPSVVAFLKNGTVIVGHDAVAQSEHNPTRTFYDAKRFVGKDFTETEFRKEVSRYPFEMVLNGTKALFFMAPNKTIAPEEIGAHILRYLKTLTQRQLELSPTVIKQSVMSAPAEFDDQQKNATRQAAGRAGVEVLRIISEPTAAALAYGLHKKESVEYVMIVDLGGGTLDVSLLFIQGGMFMTTAMAGNNHLGGQDFNVRMLSHLISEIEAYCGDNCTLTDKEDIQNLRLAVESAKIDLTSTMETLIDVKLHSLVDPVSTKPPLHFKYNFKRSRFESLNGDLLLQILNPIKAVLEDAQLSKDQVDEIVLVGGSTRIPEIRRIVADFFQKSPNYGVDPELAVVTGVAIQAGVMGGGWPLQVAATELPAKLKKIHVYREDI
uniref:Heat shock 70 kDa protein 13 n=1 Tax=Romanomermis culicivorax TaxID=13658 RepID=A0A915HHN0_ROMCU